MSGGLGPRPATAGASTKTLVKAPARDGGGADASRKRPRAASHASRSVARSRLAGVVDDDDNDDGAGSASLEESDDDEDGAEDGTVALRQQMREFDFL